MQIVQDTEFEQWYAARVRSNQEQMVASILSAKGFEILACYRERRQWSDRVKEIELPLFPGYVFCRMNLEQRISILSTPGVVHIVGIGKMPVPINGAEVDAIQRIIASGVRPRPCAFPGVGDAVRICGGPLDGVTGVLEEIRSTRRLVVSITLLQRSIAAELEEPCTILKTDSLPAWQTDAGAHGRGLSAGR